MGHETAVIIVILPDHQTEGSHCLFVDFNRFSHISRVGGRVPVKVNDIFGAGIFFHERGYGFQGAVVRLVVRRPVMDGLVVVHADAQLIELFRKNIAYIPDRTLFFYPVEIACRIRLIGFCGVGVVNDDLRFAVIHFCFLLLFLFWGCLL